MAKSVRVQDHMLKHPILVSPETDLFEAIKLILAHKVSGLTVVDKSHRVVGMLSELDVMRAILSTTYYQEEVGGQQVADHMTSEVETVGPNENIIDVAQSMLDHKHRRRPVVDSHGKLVGQVTCRNLLKGMKDLDTPKDPR